MKIMIVSPRCARAKLSPTDMLLSWRCSSGRGSTPVGGFEVETVVTERGQMLPPEARSWSPAQMWQWLTAGTPHHPAVHAHVTKTEKTSLRVSLLPDRVYAFRVSAPTSPEMAPATTVVFTKPARNYLRERLEARRAAQGSKPPRASPLFPLFVFQLDRHLHLGASERDDFDRRFDDLLRTQGTHLGAAEYRRILKSYEDTPSETRTAVFGSLPSDRNDVAWRAKAIAALVSKHPLVRYAQTHEPPVRTYTVRWKDPQFEPPGDLPMDGAFAIPAAWTGSSGETFWLRLQAGGQVRFLKMQSSALSLSVDDATFGSLDAASFQAELWRVPAGRKPDDHGRGVRVAENGELQIRAGAPIVISTEPSAVALRPDGTAAAVKVVVRDAGDGGGARLVVGGSSASAPSHDYPALRRIGRTFEHQTFELSFEGGAPPAGTYELSFQRVQTGEPPVSSMNSIPLSFGETLYTVGVESIYCSDESDPEWWGDDTIELTTPWSTAVSGGLDRISVPATKGFWSGTGETFDPVERVYGPRVIEGYLGFDLIVVEIDDLGWLDDVVNLFIGLIVLAVGAIIAIVFGPLGFVGFLFAWAALSDVGAIQQLGDWITDGLSGLGKDILHEGPLIFSDFSQVGPKSLTMETEESKYQVTLRLASTGLAQNPSG